MSKAKLNQLSDFIKNLSPESTQCLLATCFITKSKAAEDLVKSEHMILSTDSELFNLWFARYGLQMYTKKPYMEIFLKYPHDTTCSGLIYE